MLSGVEKPGSKGNYRRNLYKTVRIQMGDQRLHFETGAFGFEPENKRIRGAKKPNEFPVTTTQDAEKLLQPIQLSRRQVVLKIAAIFDPAGLWEPIKLNLKLMATELNGFEWDSPLPENFQIIWKDKLLEFVDYRLLSAKRCGIPTDEESDSKIRLIVMADAAEAAGGAAVYAGRRLKNREWTCKLVAAKIQDD